MKIVSKVLQYKSRLIDSAKLQNNSSAIVSLLYILLLRIAIYANLLVFFCPILVGPLSPLSGICTYIYANAGILLTPIQVLAVAQSCLRELVFPSLIS